ncbi:Hypothetical protein D9617_7g030600 [Elsinoe fawcettii]|nr:Hypothetical protein D9617_7g030600 [Elsinoe fawcettii]
MEMQFGLRNIVSAARLCKDAFVRLLALGGTDYDVAAAQDPIDWEYGRFKIWCANLGALQSGKSSLDARLADSPNTRTLVIRSLIQLQQALVSSCEIVSGQRRPYEEQGQPSEYVDDVSTSDEDSVDNEPPRELDMHVATIKDVLTDLYRLSFKIRRRTAGIGKSERFMEYKDVDKESGIDRLAAYTAFDRSHVQSVLLQMRRETVRTKAIFLEVDVRITETDDYLITRLANTIGLRRRMLVYQRHHARKLAGPDRDLRSSQPQVSALEYRPKEEFQETTSQLSAHNPSPLTIGHTDRTVYSGTEISKAIENIDAKLDAQSVISYSSSSFTYSPDGEYLPPPPAEAIGASEFLCPYCSTVCPQRDAVGKAWNAHVLHDLRPFICTYPDCDDESVMFATSKQWLDHERLSHRRIWQCYQHAEPTYTTPGALQSHLETTHKSELTSAQIEQLLGLSESTLADSRKSCPFCLSDGPFPTGLEKHMAVHMIRLARFSIPRTIAALDGKDLMADDNQSAAAQGKLSQSSGSVKISRIQANDFDIAWLCTRLTVFSAASMVLDNQFDAADLHQLLDLETIAFGRIGEHNLVIVCLPADTHGIDHFPALASKMAELFPSISCIVSLGVAKSLQSTDTGVRMGDIVVGDPREPRNGVIPVRTTGRLSEEPKELASQVLPLPSLATHAVRAMQYKSSRGQTIFNHFLQHALETEAEQSDVFSRPASTTARPLGSSSQGQTMRNALHQEGSDVAEGDDILQHQRQPIVHYGKIMVSETTSASIQLFEGGEQQQTDALCLDDGSVAVFQSFPSIAVRGISRDLDARNVGEWMPYASLAAAAYAKELVLTIDATDLALENQQNVTQDLTETDSEAQLATDVAGGIRRQDDSDRAADQEDARMTIERYSNDPARPQSKMAPIESFPGEMNSCLWYFETSQYNRFKDLHRHRHPRTCRWILENDQYQNWLCEPESDLLWVSAHAGMGKSVFARSLIDSDLRGNVPEGTTVCHFFFGDSTVQSRLDVALCALLHQLYEHQYDLLDHALPLWRQSKDSLRSDVDVLWQLILDSCADPRARPVICVLDGLEACPQPHHFVDRLIRFRQNRRTYTGCLKILVTARSYLHINSSIRYSRDPVPAIVSWGDTEKLEVLADIAAATRVECERLFFELGLTDDSTKDMLERRLIEANTSGSMLWLKLAIDWIRRSLGTMPSQTWGKGVLTGLPATIGHFYHRIFSEMPDASLTMLRPIFMIMSGAVHALSTYELAGALRLHPDEAVHNFAATSVANYALIDLIKMDSGGLLYLSGVEVHLSSSTVRDCLLQEPSPPNMVFGRDDVADMMALICLRCLVAFQPEEDAANSPARFNPFMSYAVSCAAHHVGHVPVIAELDISKLASLIGDRAEQEVEIRLRAELIRNEQERVVNWLRDTSYHPGSWHLEYPNSG